MPRFRDPQGRFIKNPPQVEIGSSHTPVTGKPIIEELIEKQRSGQRLTLIERQTLLAWEASKNSPLPENQKRRENKLFFHPSILLSSRNLNLHLKLK